MLDGPALWYSSYPNTLDLQWIEVAHAESGSLQTTFLHNTTAKTNTK